VIKREVETHFKRGVLKLVSGMKDNHSHLLKMFGSLKELVLPGEAEIDKIVPQIFDNVGVEVLPVPGAQNYQKHCQGGVGIGTH
jgi:hypothetical protein